MRWRGVYRKIFSSLWLLALALLVYRSRFLPRLLDVWLALGGLGWVILSLTSLLSPQYYDKVFTFTQPAVFGELAFMFWLLIKGAKPHPLKYQTPKGAPPATRPLARALVDARY
jgi:hypothetical protein